MTEFVNMPIPVEKFTAVCALLGGAAYAIQSPPVQEIFTSVADKSAPVKGDTASISEAEQIEEVLQEVIAEQPATDAEVDANGIPFDPALHTGTKKKDGTWRMKKGAVETPSSTSTASPASETADTATAPAGSSPTGEPASAVASQDDDEFAAFAAAAAKADAVEAKVPERVWTDADLGALCNQAAIKLGNPAPVKEQIAKFVPEGEVAHSRNVPADKRAEFVKAVEAAAGIEFAG